MFEIGVVTFDRIPASELVDQLRSRCTIEPDPNHEQRWIATRNGSVVFFADDSSFLSSAPPEDMDEWSRQLGGDPMSLIVLSIPSRAGSDELARDIAQLICRRWRGVIDDVDPEFWYAGAPDLQEPLQRAGPP
jgi:hypothetical protein